MPGSRICGTETQRSLKDELVLSVRSSTPRCFFANTDNSYSVHTSSVSKTGYSDNWRCRSASRRRAVMRQLSEQKQYQQLKTYNWLTLNFKNNYWKTCVVEECDQLLGLNVLWTKSGLFTTIVKKNALTDTLKLRCKSSDIPKNQVQIFTQPLSEPIPSYYMP